MHTKTMACAAMIVVEAGFAPALVNAAEEGGSALILTANGEAVAEAVGKQAEERPGVIRKTGPEQKSSAVVLETVNVSGKRNRDEKSHDDVYMKNVTTVFKDRKELSNFQTTNPGDVFKGMNGVYGMDMRSSPSITPNIRGISGEGRVPLTIDGTEQSTNVWLHMYGAGNRSYADPALFRSIEVEKGPSLSRGIKSGVGGAVNIRTIDANDIIPEGDNFGMEIKLGASGNSSKPKWNPNSYLGKDYRDIPGAGIMGADNAISVPFPGPRSKGDRQIFNFDDHSEMIAVGARNDFVDILVSRSERTKGNYYAGKNGDNDYKKNPYFADQPGGKTIDAYFPNLTKVYGAGDEVFNTSSETKNTLVKNNWYLPNNQKIGLQYMRTDLVFGETTPGESLALLGYRESVEKAYGITPQLVNENLRSNLKIDSYKLSYDVKPEDSDWVNLETSLWQTQTSGKRYQSGNNPYYIKESGALKQYNSTLADWMRCNPAGGGFPDFSQPLPSGAPATNCLPFMNQDYGMGKDKPTIPDHDGTIYAGSTQWTKHDRTGFDFSNQMKLTDKLQLTVGGSYQQERLDERVQQVSGGSGGGLVLGGQEFHMTTVNWGPRSGERKEYSAMMNLVWQPTDWLTLTAGTRYMHYTGKDTGLAKGRAARDEKFKAAQRLVGVSLKYGQLLTDQELATSEALQNTVTTTSIAADPYLFDWTSNGTVTPEISAWLAAVQAQRDFLDGRTLTGMNGGAYWQSETIVPVKDGKLDASQNPFLNGELNANEMVENAQGTGRTLARILPLDILTGRPAYEALSAEKAWEMPADQLGSAWSPVLSATAQITSYSAAFIRYAQTTRFPSIFELTTAPRYPGVESTFYGNGASKPERNTNWEIGYAHDMTQFFPNLILANIRVSYFNTEIKDFIDRTNTYDAIQFDKKKTSGFELQSRFDTGRFFGGLGGTYRLNQKLCDKNYAAGIDPYYGRVSSCMTGGFPDTLTSMSLQPKYSVDMALGTRLLNGRLEFGWRGTYHAKAENEQLEKLLNTPGGYEMWRYYSMRPMYWDAVMLHDVYANYSVNKRVAVNLNITNLTDQYYLDPMSKVLLPAPGRTVTAGLKIDL